MTTHVVALSGGKDSTAMALRLRELEPETPFAFLCTPTGNELPEMVAHWKRLECLLGTPLTRVTNGTLRSWIETWNALPNWRQRWCTRVLKIEPTIAFLLRHAPCVQYVGLRADEDEDARKGIEGDFPGVALRFPLREWGWGLTEVRAYLRGRGVQIPRRTDCAWCYGQRLTEWRALHQQHPAVFAEGAELEARTGHTFRSPQRDSYPAALGQLAAKFAEQPALPVVSDPTEDEEFGACRICRL